MNIELTINSTSFEFDLSEYFSNLSGFIHNVMEKGNLKDCNNEYYNTFDEAILDGNTFKIEASVFKIHEDIENFLNAPILNKYDAELFVSWVNELGNFSEYDRYTESFIGCYDSKEDYAENKSETCGELESVPSFLRSCIDWNKYWEQTLSHYYIAVDISNNRVAIFNSTI